MKIRRGFVSNSSSSSFVVSLRNLSLEQLCKILNYQIWGEKLGIEYAKSDAWNISIRHGMLCGDTFMDNFDMREFLDKIGVTGVIWCQRDHGEIEIESDEELPPCDAPCDTCQLRFVCYTNKWGDSVDEEI